VSCLFEYEKLKDFDAAALSPERRAFGSNLGPRAHRSH
jgi:hypothetical protein